MQFRVLKSRRDQQADQEIGPPSAIHQQIVSTQSLKEDTLFG